MKNTGRNLMMPYRNVPLREFDALQAEVAMTLGYPSLPMDKRTELERRLEAILVRAGILTSR